MKKPDFKIKGKVTRVGLYTDVIIEESNKKDYLLINLPKKAIAGMKEINILVSVKIPNKVRKEIEKGLKRYIGIRSLQIGAKQK